MMKGCVIPELCTGLLQRLGPRLGGIQFQFSCNLALAIRFAGQHADCCEKKLEVINSIPVAHLFRSPAG